MAQWNNRNSAAHGADRPARARDWRKAMSDNVATALLVYTGLLIFSAVKALGEVMEYSLVPYLLLVVLVGAIIPFCRSCEKRWAVLTDAEAADPRYTGLFRRDQLMLWVVAIGAPLLMTLLVKAFLGEG